MQLNDKRLWAAILLPIALMGITVANIGCTPTTEPAAPTPTPAAFTVSNLSIESSEVQTGEEITITAEVSNTGGSEGSYTAELQVNDEAESVQVITIPAGESMVITFSLSKDTPGTYEVMLSELTGQFVVTETVPILRSVTWSDAVVTELLAKELPDIRIYILPGNEAAIEGALIPLTVSIGVSEGKVYFGRLSSMTYDFLVAGYPDIESYTEYDGNKLWLIDLPPDVDPSEMFAPDVDKLPFVDSVTTTEGEITLTYH